MADALLKEIIATSAASEALELRLYVVAWGMTFDGIVRSAGDYNEALLETIRDNIKSAGETGSVETQKVEKALIKAAGVDAKAADDDYLHLKSARMENGGVLPWIRIPLADISGFALQAHQAAHRAKAGF